MRNDSAKLNMTAMKLGERGFFDDSNEGKAIVGIVESRALFRPDPSDASGNSAWSTSAPSSRCRSR